MDKRSASTKVGIVHALNLSPYKYGVAQAVVVIPCCGVSLLSDGRGRYHIDIGQGSVRTRALKLIKPMTLAERLSLYLQLTRINRPIGILLLLWPTLWGMWIAGAGYPAWDIVLIFVLGTVLMRSAGCAFNDYADRDIDKHVKRTKERPVTSAHCAARGTLGGGKPGAGRLCVDTAAE